jgi:hypothetical protein
MVPPNRLAERSKFLLTANAEMKYMSTQNQLLEAAEGTHTQIGVVD